MLRHPEEVDETQFCYQFVKAVKEVHPAPFKLNMLPLGAALCIADLIDVQPTDNLPPLPMREMVFGNFASGRFAWRLENIRLFPQPIPMRGLPGLWIYSEPLPDNLISVKSVQQGVFIA